MLLYPNPLSNEQLAKHFSHSEDCFQVSTQGSRLSLKLSLRDMELIFIHSGPYHIHSGMFLHYSPYHIHSGIFIHSGPYHIHSSMFLHYSPYHTHGGVFLHSNPYHNTVVCLQ